MGDPALRVFGIIPDPLDYFVGSGICPTGYHRGGRWSMVHQDLAAALYAGPQARPVTGPDRQVKLGAVQDSFRFEHKIKVDALDRKSTRLNSSHVRISYAVFCLKKKKTYKNS